MRTFLFLLSFINIIFAYELSCSSCKWFIANNKGNNDLGLCKMFNYKTYCKDKEINTYNFATHCRNDENLCGKKGNLHELDINILENDLLSDYDELVNRCCGEVNETDEIEQLERDFFDVFQRIKKHNKKRIYNTSKDLYKFFKKI